MTRYVLLRSLDSRELTDWMAFFQVEAEEMKNIGKPKQDPVELTNKIKNSLMVHQKKTKKKR